MAMKKDQMVGIATVVALFAVALFIAQAMGIFTLNVGGQSSSTTPVPETGTASNPVCSSDTQTTVHFSLYNKYTTTESMSGTIKVKIDDQHSWQTVSGNEMTLNPGDKVTIFVEPTNGYATYETYTVPCKPSAYVEIPIAPMFTSSADMVFINSLGQPNTAEDLSSDSSAVVSFKVATESKHDYGNLGIGYNYLVCKANKSEIKDIIAPKLDNADLGDVEDLVTYESGYKYFVFKMPTITSNDAKTYDLTIQSDETVDPTHNIVCTLYDTDYAIDSLTGKIISGAQDSNGNDLGLDTSAINQTLTVLIQ